MPESGPRIAGEGIRVGTSRFLLSLPRNAGDGRVGASSLYRCTLSQDLIRKKETKMCGVTQLRSRVVGLLLGAILSIPLAHAESLDLSTATIADIQIAMDKGKLN